jgi:DnaJ-class molecular chaperone
VAEDELFELRLIVEELWKGLDTYPYHVFLGVEPDERGDALQEAFHLRAAQFHPDQYYSLIDAELKRKIYAVYKRITEAYRVLSDPESRRRWDEQRQKGALRLQSTNQRFRASLPDEGLSQGARRYYVLAETAERKGDLKNARFNLQLALQFDPESPFLKEKLQKLEKPK